MCQAGQRRITGGLTQPRALCRQTLAGDTAAFFGDSPPKATTAISAGARGHFTDGHSLDHSPGRRIGPPLPLFPGGFSHLLVHFATLARPSAVP